MPASWIEHRGRQILFFDYRDQTSDEEMIATLEAGSAMMQPLRRALLLYNDFEGSVIGSAYMKRVKEVGQMNKLLIGRSALTGISGLKVIFFNAYLRATGERNTRAFQTRDQALDFLVGGEGTGRGG
jgi:hypothetical protein